jgi:cell wall-associated NlpC family hydrolase
MPDRKDVVAAARSYLGVRWSHQGRSRESGIDCAGLIIRVAWDLGLKEPGWDFNTYRRSPDGVSLEALLDEHMIPKPAAQRRPGDVLLMRHTNSIAPAHLGIVTDLWGRDAMVHSYVPILHGKVSEQILNIEWINKIHGCYAYAGMED